MSTVYDFSALSIDGQPADLAAQRGKVLLIVNTASACGFTPQFAGLEELHRKYGDRGLVVLGFPCNQFGAQEPGPESDIITFCTTSYNVTFPLSAKVDVNGPARHPLYAWLTTPSNRFAGDIQWNFEKFLIGRDGSVLARYPSGTKPDDNGMMQEIADAL
jgi:glutathione peroxidase